MKKDNFLFLLFFGVTLFALLFLSGCLDNKKACYAGQCQLNDSEYSSIAKETSEAMSFLKKYPDANIFVERGDDLSANFVVGDYSFIDLNKGVYEERAGNRYLRLRIFINPLKNAPTSSFIECHSTADNFVIINRNLTDYISTESCLE